MPAAKNWPENAASFCRTGLPFQNQQDNTLQNYLETSLKGNGAVYNDLNLARVSRRAINRMSRADRSCGTLTLSPRYTLQVIESS